MNSPGGDVDVVAIPDFRETVDWGALLDGVESVVHLAGIAHTDGGEDDYDRVIYRASADLAEACDAAGVGRLVFVSSVVAGSCPSESVVADEHAEANTTIKINGQRMRFSFVLLPRALP